MKAFMLGWEFPPYISGGLGTACHGLTKALDEIGVEVSFILPTPVPMDGSTHVRLKSPLDLGLGSWESEYEYLHSSEEFRHVRFHRVAARLQAYASPAAAGQIQAIAEHGKRASVAVRQTTPAGTVPQAVPAPPPPVAAGAHYGGDMMAQVHRYARLALELSKRERFDVIHAHDWMTFPAALAVAAASHKPLVVHVHSTEFDRSGQNVNPQIYEIERTGMHGADRVVCVSYLTRNIVTSRYDVPPSRVEVVYNAVEMPTDELMMKPIGRHEKIVLFLGRLTMQKGPEYFLRAAKKVVDKYDNVRFVVAGSGDMVNQCVDEVANLRLGRYVTFAGFLRGADVAKVFKMADLYVMPSVSEPFGIAPLEALSHNVPVIISKQSGVSEVLTHVLKVDFWDIDEMANKILAVLRHPPLQKTLRQHGHIELRKLSWHDSAVQVKNIYSRVVSAAARR